MSERDINDSPWCWQSKEICRAIREAAGDAHTMRRDSLAVYRALSELASDKQASVFPATHAMIFDQSGVSVPQIKRALNFLRGNHFVDWTTPQLRGPCVYVLLSYHVSSIDQPELTLAPGELTIAPRLVKGRTATSEESEKNLKKNHQNNIAPAKPPRARDALFDCIAEVTGTNPAVSGGELGKAKAAILAASPAVTPDEIRRRAANYRANHPELTMGPSALAKWWPESDKLNHTAFKDPYRQGNHGLQHTPTAEEHANGGGWGPETP